MKLNKIIFLLILSLNIISLNVFGQSDSGKNNGLSPQQAASMDENRSRQLVGGQEAALRELSSPPAESVLLSSREKANLKLVKSNILPIPKNYLDKYAVLLKTEKLQLAKLLNTNCYDGKIVTVNESKNCENVLQIWGGGSFYSFRNKSNFNSKSEVWSDIRLANNSLIVGTNSVLGIISSVGDTDVKDISISSPEIKFLKEYKSQEELSKINSEIVLIKSGIRANGFAYSNTAPIKLNSTYILRSIAYRTKSDEIGDNRIDLIIALKIVGIEDDGSLIILWKQLTKNNSPKLKSI